MSLVGVVGKDRKNEQQWYKFRGIDDMYNALNEHLATEKVFFTSEVLESTREERITKNGGLLMYSILKMKFTAYAEDGSFVESTTIGEAMDTGDKSMNKAMSTAYKYALMQIFCIPTEEDKDTENNTHEIAWNNAPISNDVPKIPTTPTKPYITSPTITLMIQDVKEGKIQVSSVEALIEMARKKYIVAKWWAEDEFRKKYEAVDKSKQITN